MKVRQIVNIFDNCVKYNRKKEINSNRLQWELISVGESDKTEKLKKQIEIDKKNWEHYLDEEV